MKTTQLAGVVMAGEDAQREHFLERLRIVGLASLGEASSASHPAVCLFHTYRSASHPTVLGDRLTLLANSRKDPYDAFTI